MTGNVTMTQSNPSQTVQRRGFLTTLGLGGAAAVATAAASIVVAEPAAAMVPSGGKAGAHYRESEHVKKFYKVNSY